MRPLFWLIPLYVILLKPRAKVCLFFGLLLFFSHSNLRLYANDHCDNLQTSLEVGVLKNERFQNKEVTVRDLTGALSNPFKGVALNKLINPESEVLLGVQTVDGDTPHYFLMAKGHRLDGLIIEPVKNWFLSADHAPAIAEEMRNLFYFKISDLSKEQVDKLTATMELLDGSRQLSCSFTACRALKEGAGIEFYSPSGMHVFLETTLVSILQKGARKVDNQKALPLEVIKIKGGSLEELREQLARKDQEIAQGQFVELLQRPGISRKFLKEPLPPELVAKLNNNGAPPSKELIVELEEALLLRRRDHSPKKTTLSGTATSTGLAMAIVTIGPLSFLVQGNSWQLHPWASQDSEAH